MPDDNWQLSDGTGDWELSDGTGHWLILEGVAEVSAGGKSSGQRLVQLPRRSRKELETTDYKIKFIMQPTLEKQFFRNIKASPVYEQITHHKLNAKVYSKRKNKFKTKYKVTGILNPEYTLCFVGKIFTEHILKGRELKIDRVLHKPFYMTLLAKRHQGLDMIKTAIALLAVKNPRLIPNNPRILNFSFIEDKSEWEESVYGDIRLNAEIEFFRQSSSFVGEVQYDTEAQQLFIDLNGRTYVFCNVPQFIYDEFKDGRRSKGRYFNQVLKGGFQCF